MKTYSVFYVFPNDSIEYRATIRAFDADAADRAFRNGLNVNEMWDVTVARIEEDRPQHWHVLAKIDGPVNGPDCKVCNAR